LLGREASTSWFDSLTAVQGGGVATIRVRDDGIGIAAEKLPIIFGLFSRATPTSSAAGSGLGVGLAVAKQLIELHGGSIFARSEGVGQGSEFTVRLPIHATS
jgi:signal transduction histidine kinase